MGIVRTGETEFEKEEAKWNKPYRYEPFPKMLYKAAKINGLITVLSVEGEHDQKCTRIVKSERELSEALAAGWHLTPQAAYNAMAQHDQDHADAAAEVNYEVSKMSKKARREFAAESAATDGHLVK